MPQLLILTEEHGHGGVHSVTGVLQQQLLARGWTVGRQPVRGPRIPLLQLWRQARQADVLLASNNFRPAYVAVLLGLLCRRPSVVWVHGPLRQVLAQPRSSPGTWTATNEPDKPDRPGAGSRLRAITAEAVRTLKQLGLRWVLQQASARVCVSETSRQSLLTWLAPAAADARLIRNPAPACSPLRETATRSSAGDTVELGLVARLSPEKRPGLALQTLRLLPARYRLTLLGDGPLQATLRVEGADLLHDGRLLIPGGTEVTVQTYGRWQVSLLCSAYEGYPLAALESLAAGVPCVGPPLPALQEMLGPQAADWLAEDDSPQALARAIERCLLAPPVQRQQRAQAIARAHDADSFGLRWHQLLLALIPSTSSRGRA